MKRALITAGIEILTQSGVGGFSLRKVAIKAGVSHTAPYAHFKDKRALIAAIMTEGFCRLYDRMSSVLAGCGADAQKRLLEAAWAYVDFAVAEKELFSILFSGILDNEQDFPEYNEMTHQCYRLLSDSVRFCQAAKLLPPEPIELASTRLWSCLHGFASLLINGQISHLILEKQTIRQLVKNLIVPVTVS
ncbi:MAG: hypothetical protein A2Y35_14480 [Spirochaetes bacterium GWE1_60_18]|nr:MAG: hypothetical protein A2Y35_14480 [Spirochaetes bacterium GWE1_60_18]